MADQFKVCRIEQADGAVDFKLYEWTPPTRWFRRGSWDWRATHPTKDAAEADVRKRAQRPYVTNSYYYDRFGAEDVSW